MTKRPAPVREPIQVYMAQDERRLLDQLASQTGLSRAEILRQGLRRFAADRAVEGGPMQELLRSFRRKSWPADIAKNHDEHLAKAYLDKHDK